MAITQTIKERLPQEWVDHAKRIKHKYLNKHTGVNLYRRLEALLKENPEINTLFPFEEFMNHYVYEPARQSKDNPDVFINQIRYYRMYVYFKAQYPEVFSPETCVVDIGDTSGTFFRAMKRKGLSVNINPEVIEFIKKKGIDAQLGNIEVLPFADKSFDYCFCFQCLEHLPNPIKALNELSRITRKMVFVSIPYVKETKIYSRTFWQELKKKPVAEGGWNEQDVKDVDGHKFEFSTADFKKIITHAQLEFLDQYPINYFSPLGTTKKNEGSYFNFFILKPVS